MDVCTNGAVLFYKVSARWHQDVLLFCLPVLLSFKRSVMSLQLKKIALAAAIASTLAIVGCQKKDEQKAQDTAATADSAAQAAQAATDAATAAVPAADAAADASAAAASAAATASSPAATETVATAS